jgi:hypothetical protein
MDRDDEGGGSRHVSVTELRVTVVDADLAATTGMWGDSTGGWQPPGAAWVGLLAALGVPHQVQADIDAATADVVIDPAGAVDDVGDRTIIRGGPPATGEETLRLLAAHLGAVVVPDLRNVLVLRLDDPGAAVKEHLASWAHPPVPPSTWDALWAALEGFGRASVFCCPGYVLTDGRVVDSRDHLPQEWAALDAGMRRGLADLECHGYTHMHPDAEAWALAPDGRTDERWFRELWPPALAQEPTAAAQAERLNAWQRSLNRSGTALVAPGEEWGLNTLAAAQQCGFTLFNSWGLCFLDRQVPTWSQGIGSPYLDQPDPSWFADCLPQIGYWHDRDMAIHGPRWVADQLDAWRACGAARAMSFADVAAAYTPIDAALVDGDVVIRSAPDVPLRVVRP